MIAVSTGTPWPQQVDSTCCLWFWTHAVTFSNMTTWVIYYNFLLRNSSKHSSESSLGLCLEISSGTRLTCLKADCLLVGSSTHQHQNHFPMTLTHWSTSCPLELLVFSFSDLNIMLPRSSFSSTFTLNSTIIGRFTLFIFS